MAKLLPLTIIDDKNIRGVLAPSKFISKELLEDIVDLIEWSSPEAVKETEERVAEADRNKSWIPGKEVERRLRDRERKLRARERKERK
jgi:hypothetical protein